MTRWPRHLSTLSVLHPGLGVAGGFKGVSFALYANRNEPATPAFFEWFEARRPVGRPSAPPSSTSPGDRS